MKVILIDEIRGLGSRGDVVTVKDGYARNFLLPKQLAREATPGNLKSIEQERKKWAALGDQEKAAAQKAADSVKGTKIVIHKRVGDHDVEVRLHREVAAHIQVEVVPEGKESIIEEAPVAAAAPAPAAAE